MPSFFETEHLKVRAFERTDAACLYQNHTEDAVKRWIPNESYRDTAEADAAIHFFRQCVEQKKLPYVLAVELKENGALIGDTGINEVEGCPSQVEIGYTISDACAGKGYATELVQAMMHFCALELGVHTFYGRVLRGNLASVRVLEKNGFAFLREEMDAEDDPYGCGMLVYRKDIQA